MLQTNRLPSVGRANGGRLGNRKVRTGCLTCKRRKIKCDEGYPACVRCTSTGRSCGGYADTGGSSRGTVSASPPLPRAVCGSAIAVHDEAESRALTYFVTVGARLIAGHSDLDLWSRLVPQMGHSIPAVRHAAIAIGSILLDAVGSGVHAAGSSGGRQSSVFRPANDFAIRHYHKAVQLTMHAINQGQDDAAMVAGATCILFFCIEALQGHESEALGLYKSAKVAFRPPTYRGGSRSSTRSGRGNSNDTTKTDLAAVFSRLAIQYVMFMPGLNDESPDIVAQLEYPIESMAQAQAELIDLITLAFNITSVGFELKWGTVPKERPDGEVLHANDEAFTELAVRRDVVSAAFERWNDRFIAYRQRCRQRRRLEPPEEAVGWSLVRMHYQAMSLWLAGTTSRAETVFDAHEARFCELVAEAEVVLALLEPMGMKTHFTFEMGLIPPLYITVQKCRDPILRRRALALLRRAPAQEGLWNRHIVAQVSQRIIELEEGLDGFIENPPPALAKVVVPEEKRLKFVAIAPRSVDADGRSGDFVEFYALPHGYDGEWSLTREFFAV